MCLYKVWYDMIYIYNICKIQLFDLNEKISIKLVIITINYVMHWGEKRLWRISENNSYPKFNQCNFN